MDRNSDVALMHNLYYNYENLGGLTGQWEPENTDDDSNASSSSPSPCEFKKPRSDSRSSSSSRSSNKKDSNENFTNGRTSICDNPESPTFPRFPDLVEDLVGSPLKTPPSVMKSTDETLETTEASEEDKRRVQEKDEEEKKKEVEESSTGNGEGVRWVFNTPYFYPNGTGSPLYGSDYDDSDNSILSVSSAGSVKRKNKQNNNRVDKDNKDLRKLLGLDKKKPAKKQTRNKATHSEIKKLLTSPSFGSAVSGMISPPCPENAVGLLSALANKTVANISNGGLNIPMSPFENCATPGSTPGATPDTNEGSNRKGRRKNIKNSRQLSQMNSVKNSPVFLGMNLSSPVISPKKKSPGLPKINFTGSPIVIAPDQQHQQQRYNNTSSPEQDPASPIYHAEHSTFDCAVCKESVCKLLGNNRSHGVVDHEDSSIGTSCHICEYCNMAFPSGQKLKSHLRCHIKPFPCTVCNKSFTNSGNLKKHMRTHTGEKPYKCPLCDAAWANPSNLKRHMLKHDIHKCSSCEKDFPNSCTMSVVTERITGNRLYVCQNCLTDNGQKYLKGKQQNRPFP